LLTMAMEKDVAVVHPEGEQELVCVFRGMSISVPK